jgi:heme exporter protein C
VKALAHWLVTGLPLTLIAPGLAVLLNLPPAGYLMAGPQPFPRHAGAVGHRGLRRGADRGLRRGGLLLSLLVLPLVRPDPDLRRRGGARGAEGMALATPLGASGGDQPWRGGAASLRGGQRRSASICARLSRDGVLSGSPEQDRRKNVDLGICQPEEVHADLGLGLPWVVGLTIAFLVVGLVWGFFFTPDDYKQGATVKIIYLHVPAAMMAINAWGMMLVTSLIWIVRRHHVSALAAKAAAPGRADLHADRAGDRGALGPADVGHLVGLGPAADLVPDPDAVLFRLYGALGGGREPRYRRRPDLDPLPRRVGLRAAQSRYAVLFWNQGLHQGASCRWTRKRTCRMCSGCRCLVCIAGFVLLFVTMVLMRTRTEIRSRRLKALLARERVA